MREIIEKEYEKVIDEIERAQADGNSDLAHLEGWEKALQWVLLLDENKWERKLHDELECEVEEDK